MRRGWVTDPAQELEAYPDCALGAYPARLRTGYVARPQPMSSGRTSGAREAARMNEPAQAWRGAQGLLGSPLRRERRGCLGQLGFGFG